MAATSYYNDPASTAYPSHSSTDLSTMKPMLVSDNYSLHGQQGYNDVPDYVGMNGAPAGYTDLRTAQRDDETLKHRIRLLKLLSRVAATIMSLVAFIPLLLTLIKFLETRNTYKTVSTPTGDITRTPWALHTTLWPTTMYFTTSLLSLLLNAAVLVFYAKDLRAANRASSVASTWSTVVLVGQLAGWVVIAALYRVGKGTGDLWGWSCSAGAQEIQKVFFGEVDFERFCGIQSFSWYAGLAQVGLAALSLVIYWLAVRRLKSKKKVNRLSGFVGGGGYEPARHRQV